MENEAARRKAFADSYTDFDICVMLTRVIGGREDLMQARNLYMLLGRPNTEAYR